MSTNLAQSPGPVFEPVDLPIPGGRLVRDAWGGITVCYEGLPPVPSWPIDTPEKRKEAEEVAGGCLFTANYLHELIHCLGLPKWLGLPHSPTIFAAAQRAAGLRKTWWGDWWAEENAVFEVRRLAVKCGVDLENKL